MLFSPKKQVLKRSRKERKDAHARKAVARRNIVSAIKVNLHVLTFASAKDVTT